MNIQNINFLPINCVNNNKNSYIKMNNISKPDSVQFGKISPKQKMSIYAVKLLKECNLQENQSLYIKADSKYLLFIDILEQEAYKKGAGLIHSEIVEPEIEALKKKYNITQKADYRNEREQEFKDRNAIFLTFDEQNNLYSQCGLSEKEILSEIMNFAPVIPKNIQKKFKLNPEEIFIKALDIREGQPVSIVAEREQLPFVVQLVDYLYSKNNTKLVDVTLSDKLILNKYKYAKDDILEDILNSEVTKYKERFEKDIAYLQLDGEDPNLYEGIDSDRIVKYSKARSAKTSRYHSLMAQHCPWLVYYMPSMKLAQEVYPEFKDDPMRALAKAYEDATSMNRCGELDVHIKTLENRAQIMNNLLQKGYNTLHYVSVDPKTEQPDGKTDFRVTLSQNSRFQAATMRFEKYNHTSIVNIPSEEIFTSPLNNTAEGKISATMPLVLNGKIIDGIVFEFHNGQIVDIKADTNEDMLKKHIQAYKNADRLGEVALVAGSPIAKSGRLFKNTLLDENAACHLALGDSYPDTIEGADNIEDYDEQQEFLKAEHINTSDTHNDFMVGGKNVYIYAENPKTGHAINVIKDDKFMLGIEN